MKRSFLWLLPLLLLSACQLSKKEPYTNRLVDEKSLYLRQHAHNPVDWYPWGEEALEKARAEGKLLLISIGYASCHWCHVMEEETFSDTSVARFMNQYFVNIKVDREERPDVDDIYMAACQYAGNQSCGWPLNAFATPDGRPVWAGTYFPKKEWVEIVEYFADLYRNDPQKVAQYANELTSAVSDLNIVRRAGEEHPLSADTLASLAARFKAAADPVWGGRKGAPKFPMPNSYAFLLSYHRFAPDEELLGLIQTTLDKLAQGGIYDHLGGGFARYSVDAFWKVPHFEKMLYDNAQLISLYSQAYRLTRKDEYARLIRQTLDFIAREMTSPEGGFYASLDADSEGEEGTFYVWTEAQIRNSIGDEALSKIFLDFYQITSSGNWERGKNVLFAKDFESAFAREKGMEEKQLKANLEQARQKLFDARAKRPRPRLDEKVIASWNALMLEAYIEAWWALGDPAYLQAARKNAGLLSGKMRDKDGGLFRTYAQGKASIPAFLDDYASTIHAFLTLYEATFEERWLQEAQALMEKAEERFWDEKQGVYFYAADDHSGLVARRAELNDNVMPASNSVMARNAFRMERFYPEKGYEAKARAMLDRLWPGVSAHEDLTYFSNWSRLYLDFLQAPFEVAIVGELAGVKRDTMLQEYLPNAVWMGSAADSELDLLKGKYREGKTQIYVCRNRVCRLPVEYTEEALGQMMEKWQE